MALVWADLGNKLLEAAKVTYIQAIIVSPFITGKAFHRLIETIPNEVEIKIFTRWRVEELATGISEIKIWDLIKGKKNWDLFLINNLHSKYYRFDSMVFVGSANLTLPGLSWSRASNIEILTTEEELTDNHLQYEEFLHANATLVTEEIYERMMSNVESYIKDKPDNLYFTDEFIPEFASEKLSYECSNTIWIPVTRSPDALYLAYKNIKEALSNDVTKGCLIDLARFELPLNLNENQFNKLIGSRLETERIVCVINQFLVQPRRFGEMVDLIRNYENENASAKWQLFMRWLLYFLPTRYSANVANHSEIISLKKN
jgi:hypothetical protein